MTKEEVLAQFKVDLAAAQDVAVEKVFTAAFDLGVASVPALPAVDMGLPADEELKAKELAVAEAIAPLNDELIVLHAQVEALAAEKADVEGKLAADEVIVQNLKGSIEKLKGALVALQEAVGV